MIMDDGVKLYLAVIAHYIWRGGWSRISVVNAVQIVVQVHVWTNVSFKKLLPNTTYNYKIVCNEMSAFMFTCIVVGKSVTSKHN